MASSSTFSLALQSLKLDSESHIAPHIAPLKSSTSYVSIALNGNTLGVPAAAALAPLLASQSALETINLGDLFTGRLLSEIPQALESLLTALLKCPQLHTVDLSDNAFGLNTVGPLVAFLRAHTPLQHLILNNNGLGPQAGAAVADALSELATKKKEKGAEGLKTIVCGRNRLETGSMEAWARAYGHMPGMESVKMVQNGIRQEGIIMLLSQGLSHCHQLRVVDLQDNTFTKTGSQALAKALPHWPALEELGVGDCLVGARGFVLVAEALASGANKSLKTIRAQYDEVDARGIGALVKAAKVDQALPALQRVELNGNKFKEEDDALLKLQELLWERREGAGAEAGDESWGVDELSDLEDESDEEDEDEDERDEDEEAAVERREDRQEEEAKREQVLADADEAEGEKVAQKKDPEVDALADALGKTL